VTTAESLADVAHRAPLSTAHVHACPATSQPRQVLHCTHALLTHLSTDFLQIPSARPAAPHCRCGITARWSIPAARSSSPSRREHSGRQILRVEQEYQGETRPPLGAEEDKEGKVEALDGEEEEMERSDAGQPGRGFNANQCQSL
jgi:hypothetical protein